MNYLNIYKDYTVEQWIEDPDFITWLRKPDSNEKGSLFTDLMLHDEDVAVRMKEAASIIASLKMTEPKLRRSEIDEMWRNIKRGTANVGVIQMRRYLRVISVAASLVLVLGLSLFFVLRNYADINLQKIAEASSVNNVSGITLKIKGRPDMVLSDKTEIIMRKGHLIIRTFSRDEIALNDEDFSPKDAATLLVPKGKKATVVFEDGSKAVVRPGSKVSFPTEFEAKKRQIYVDGEVFLQVSKNKTRPFYVKTSQMNVEVLGTSFDVQAYANERVNSVVLVTGHVRVDTKDGHGVDITPNQMFSYDKAKGSAGVSEVDVNHYIGWKDGILQFDSESLPAVLRQLSNYYGTDFDCESNQKLQNIKITGKLDMNKDLKSVLDVLSEISNTRYVNTMKSRVKIYVEP